MRQPKPSSRIRAYLLGKDLTTEERTLQRILETCCCGDAPEMMEAELEALVSAGRIVRVGEAYLLSDVERHQIAEDFRMALRLRGHAHQ